MQNAMNIITMMQNSSIVKSKVDVPSKASGVEKNSFKTQLNKAQRSVSAQKYDPSTTENTIKNKENMLSKVVSSSSSKSEVKDQVSVDTAEQNEAVGVINEKLQKDEQAQESLIVEEDMQPILEMLQQLMEQLHEIKAQGTDNTKLVETQETIVGFLNKLNEMLAKPITNQAAQINNLIENIGNELDKLEQHLSLVSEQKLEFQQSKQSIVSLLTNIDNEIPKLQQKMQGIVVKAKQRPVEEPVNLQTAGSIHPESSVNTIESSNKASYNHESMDEQNNDESGTSYKAQTNDEAKIFQTSIKPNQEIKVENIVINNDIQNAQITLKNMQSAEQKQTFVQINKSDIINQVVKKADIIMQNGQQEMIMKLEPESLGKLNLKVTVEDGIITAKFVAESQQVKEILESSFNQLKDALQEKGISLQSLSVSVGQQGAEFNSNQSFGQWKRSIKLNNKNSLVYIDMDDELTKTNPYSYHDGKVDFRA